MSLRLTFLPWEPGSLLSCDEYLGTLSYCTLRIKSFTYSNHGQVLVLPRRQLVFMMIPFRRDIEERLVVSYIHHSWI